jgi:hypothetical protein
MSHSRLTTKAISWLCAAWAACGLAAPSTAQNTDPAVEATDRAFVQAVSRSDGAALTAMLDPDFAWTDVMGKTQTATEIARALPTPMIADETKAQTEIHAYRAVASVQVHNGKQHTLRIWVKRPAGWRALAYQEVQLRDTPPPVAAAPAAGAECINPCQSIPYQGRTPNEHAVAASFAALETAVKDHDAEKWASLIGDEFAALSSGSDRLLDKKTRRAELERASMAGLVPVPLVSARMTEVGDAIVMVSQHQPASGKPTHATRLWLKRGGGWVEVVSYQTTIQAALAR